MTTKPATGRVRKAVCAHCLRPIIPARVGNGWVHDEPTGHYYYCPYSDAMEQNVHAEPVTSVRLKKGKK